jgi:hypothetical protein
MRRTLLTVFFAGLAVGSTAFSQGFELELKEIKMTKKNAEVFPELEVRVQKALSAVEKEPRYKTKSPQLFTTSFGGDDGIDVAFAADEMKGYGKGFDSLFADVTGGGNLAKGKRLRGKPVRRGSSSEDTTFRPFDVEIPAGEDAFDYKVQARLAVSRPTLPDRTPTDATLYLTSLACLEGGVAFGEMEQEMVVFDANCNGVFGETGSVSGGKLTQGDKVWVGKKSRSLEDAYVEALPLGKYFLFDGKYYELSISPENFVDIKPADLELGMVNVSSSGFLLELRQANDVLYISNTEGTELAMPVGDYKVTTPGFRRKQKRDVWELQGEVGSVDESFSITGGETTELEVGPPLRLVVSNTMKRSGTGFVVSLRFGIEGSNGEKYKYLRKNGKRVKLPEVVIRDEKGKEVKKGHFEYG